MEPGIAKIRVRLGSGPVVEVVPLRRAWQPRFFLAREAEDKPVLMLHETQVVAPNEESENQATDTGFNHQEPK